MAQISENRVLIGNPGSGKSTLWNCHLGQIMFASGTTLDGQGLTDHLQEFILDFVKYMDTPGLADIEKRKKAAQEIQKALMAEGKYRLMFVLRSNGGRLNPEDVTTMMLVLQASQQIGQDNYGIIINSCGKAWLQKVESYGFEKWMSESLHRRMAELRLPTTKHVHLAPHKEDLLDEDSVIVPLSDATNMFLREGVPAFALDPDLIEEINAESFADIQEKCAEYQEALKQEAEKMEKLANAKKESDEMALLAQRKLDEAKRNSARKEAEYLEEIAKKDKAKRDAENQARIEREENKANFVEAQKQAHAAHQELEKLKQGNVKFAAEAKNRERLAEVAIEQAEEAAKKAIKQAEIKAAQARREAARKEPWKCTHINGWVVGNYREVSKPANFDAWIAGDMEGRCCQGTQLFPWGHSYVYLERVNRNEPMEFKSGSGIRWIDHHRLFEYEI